MNGEFKEYHEKNKEIDILKSKQKCNEPKKELTTEEQLEIFADIIVNYLISKKSEQ